MDIQRDAAILGAALEEKMKEEFRFHNARKAREETDANFMKCLRCIWERHGKPKPPLVIVTHSYGAFIVKYLEESQDTGMPEKVEIQPATLMILGSNGSVLSVNNG